MLVAILTAIFLVPTSYAGCVGGFVEAEEYTASLPRYCPIDGGLIISDASADSTKMAGGRVWHRHSCPGYSDQSTCRFHVFWAEATVTGSSFDGPGTVRPFYDPSFEIKTDAATRFWNSYDLSGLAEAAAASREAQLAVYVQFITEFKRNDPEGYAVFKDAGMDALRNDNTADTLAVGAYAVGLARYYGQRGVAKTYLGAAAAFEVACSRRELRACSYLGTILWKGLSGPPDPIGAASLFMRACSPIAGEACRSLGEMYRAGEGVPEANERTALRYFRKGCRAGDEYSCKRLTD
jgi:TPR repeat protein